jgi:GNAT superfamily N-acetyltransferase
MIDNLSQINIEIDFTERARMSAPNSDIYYVRPAVAEDTSELSALVNSAYRGDSSREGWTTEADFLGGQRTDPQSLENQIAQPNYFILCLREKESNELRACVALEKFKDNKGVGCYLGMLTVRPTLQSHGVGKYLMSVAEDYGRDMGAVRMTLNVIHVREELMAWYERRGYVRTGETKPFPYGDEAFGLPKRDDLHFIYFEKSLRTTA